jgi:AcrR family transcriptional regulator
MDTKDMILDVAFKGFLEQGFEKISLNELVNRSGLSKGTFYYHFKSKEALLSEVIKKYFKKFIEKQNEYEDCLGNSMDEYVSKLFNMLTDVSKNIDGVCGMKVDIRQFFLLLNEGLRRDEQLMAFSIQRKKKTNDLMIKMVEKGQGNGELRNDLLPEEIANILRVYTEGVLTMWLYRENGSLDDSLKDNLLCFFKLIKSN